MAIKSAEAVNQTSELIEHSLTAVQHGTSIADDTAKALTTVVDGAGVILDSVNKINAASQNQKRVLQEITKSVSLIEEVVQSNNLAVQESVVTSDKLSRQSELLHELVNRFHLKKF